GKGKGVVPVDSCRIFASAGRSATPLWMRLFRFRYSPYARKVQMVLDLLGLTYELIEVPYSDRNELATLTGGYIYVPVLEDDDGTVVVESRAICERLIERHGVGVLVPSPLE